MPCVFCRETLEEMNYDLNTFWWRETCPRAAEWADILLFYRASWDIELAQILRGWGFLALSLVLVIFYSLYSINTVLQLVLKSKWEVFALGLDLNFPSHPSSSLGWPAEKLLLSIKCRWKNTFCLQHIHSRNVEGCTLGHTKK